MMPAMNFAPVRLIVVLPVWKLDELVIVGVGADEGSLPVGSCG